MEGFSEEELVGEEVGGFDDGIVDDFFKGGDKVEGGWLEDDCWWSLVEQGRRSYCEVMVDGYEGVVGGLSFGTVDDFEEGRLEAWVGWAVVARGFGDGCGDEDRGGLNFSWDDLNDGKVGGDSNGGCGRLVGLEGMEGMEDEALGVLDGV